MYQDVPTDHDRQMFSIAVEFLAPFKASTEVLSTQRHSTVTKAALVIADVLAHVNLFRSHSFTSVSQTLFLPQLKEAVTLIGRLSCHLLGEDWAECIVSAHIYICWYKHTL